MIFFLFYETYGRSEEEKEEEGGNVRGGEEVYFGVIMTNTEIFDIFHIISLFNLPFLKYFPNLFTI